MRQKTLYTTALMTLALMSGGAFMAEHVNASDGAPKTAFEIRKAQMESAAAARAAAAQGTTPIHTPTPVPLSLSPPAPSLPGSMPILQSPPPPTSVVTSSSTSTEPTAFEKRKAQMEAERKARAQGGAPTQSLPSSSSSSQIPSSLATPQPLPSSHSSPLPLAQQSSSSSGLPPASQVPSPHPKTPEDVVSSSSSSSSSSPSSSSMGGASSVSQTSLELIQLATEWDKVQKETEQIDLTQSGATVETLAEAQEKVRKAKDYDAKIQAFSSKPEINTLGRLEKINVANLVHYSAVNVKNAELHASHRASVMGDFGTPKSPEDIEKEKKEIEADLAYIRQAVHRGKPNLWTEAGILGFSDERLKEIYNKTANALKKVDALNPGQSNELGEYMKLLTAEARKRGMLK